ncbi:hypothetical protein QYE76_046562 [Lolium multiflorum]|uniref:Reverse transcriptase domain-containing protein n=1 Tax=Lolium multiflorum TaxID=4521 RepID=A0AAD8WZA1_LOLMU|nr:hypothetical protein QYE76_046562 [Lolium multiflorum]
MTEEGLERPAIWSRLQREMVEECLERPATGWVGVGLDGHPVGGGVPERDGAEDILDYRPISLIHAIAKIIAKVFALRLSPLMNDLVSNAQSAFIKKRSIHDNFLYARNLDKRFHKNKTPTLLFKLDIRKAFDSIRWEFIVDLLQ